MGDGQDLARYWTTIEKNKRKILLITILILLLTTITTLLIPKTYESVSVIQLCTAEGGSYTAVEAKTIIESSVILQPVIEDFFAKKEKMDLERFKKERLDVEVIAEKITPTQIAAIPYIKITVSADSAQKTSEINKRIIANFFNYAKPKCDNLIDVSLERILVKEKNIEELKEDVMSIKGDISAMQNEQLDTEEISKVTLLKDILAGYKERLASEEKERLDAKEALYKSRGYEVVSEPLVPLKPSRPILLLNIVLSFIVGLFFSVFLVFFRKAIKGK